MELYETIKSRLTEEIKGCEVTTVQIGKMIGVSPKMVTQYMTTKKLP